MNNKILKEENILKKSSNEETKIANNHFQSVQNIEKPIELNDDWLNNLGFNRDFNVYYNDRIPEYSLLKSRQNDFIIMYKNRVQVDMKKIRFVHELQKTFNKLKIN